MTQYAEIAVNAAVNQTFHYEIPVPMRHKLWYGHLVRVAFGTAMQQGIVVDLHHELPPDLHDVKLKPIIEILDPDPVMTFEHVELAMDMHYEYLAPPGQCLWLMLPPGLTQKSTRQVHLIDTNAEGKNSTQQEIIDLLREESPQRLDALSKQVSIKTVKRVLNEMEDANILRMESVLAPPRVSPKTIETVVRAIPEEEIVAALATLKRAPKQTKVFSYIARHDYPLDVTDVYDAVDATRADLNNLKARGLIQYGGRIVYRDSLADKDFVPSTPPTLLDGQQQVWEVLRDAIRVRYRESRTARLKQQDNMLSTEDTTSTQSSSPPQRFGEGLGVGTDVQSFSGWLRAYTTKEQFRKLKIHARRMRQNATPAEDKLWQQLRGRKVNGIKFRRQHPIDIFIVDFCSPTERLIIEVDGSIHEEQQEYDTIRQQYLEYLGYTVLRFTNSEVIKQIDGVLEVIGETLYALRQSFPTPNPSPTLWGGEQSVSSQDNHQDRAGQTKDKNEQTEQPIPKHRDQKQAHPETANSGRDGVGFKKDDTNSNTYLLHGVTGSGKTEIYLHAIAEVLAQGRQAIFLVPEIALTPQTIRRVAQRFPEQVAVVHGSLSPGERYDTWRRARQGDIGVIVGTRSALFTPLPDVGVIILDEEHDHSYKQSPPFNPPYYHARTIAEDLAEMNNAIVILGSATPDMETYYRAQRGQIHYLHLPQRIMGHKQRVTKQAQKRHVQTRYEPLQEDAMTIGLPPVHVVDMREELKAGNTTMFSRQLQDALEGTLNRGEQAILFLNRRGQASYVFCRDCGYRVDCNRCDMPMTYHRYDDKMRCHHCNNQQNTPTACPECGSRRIRYFGAGTQHVEAALHEQFPDARLVRWDADTASKPDMHEKILARFANGEADVMVGTQMIAKGLDLPLVTLVGVVSADPGLALPDFRANERAFQLLTQVAGRAGRGILGGQVVLQTYQPKHPSIVAASNHDYTQFYTQEIEARRELGYPPFRRMGRILVQDKHPIEAQRQIEQAAEQVRHAIKKHDLTDTQLIGPAPCFFGRIDRHYRWQLLIRSVDPIKALEDVQIMRGWYVDIDPTDIL